MQVAASAGERHSVAGVDVEDVAGGLARRLGSEEVDALGHVLREHAALKQAALAVELLDVAGADLVRGRALLPPRSRPDPGAADDSVRVDHVDADPEWCALQRQAARQVDLGGLGGAVGGGAGRCGQRVLAAHEYDAATPPLLLQQPVDGARHEEVAGGQHVHVLAPQIERSLLHRGGRGDAGIGHDDVETAEATHGVAECGHDRGLVDDVHDDAVDDVLAVAPRQVGHRLLQGAGVHVRQGDAGPLRQEPQRGGTADAAGAAGDEGDAAGQAPGLRHALQLGLLEQPVLDVERLLLGQAHVPIDGAGAAHDVDGIDVELPRAPGGGLVLGVGQHAHPGDEVDDRVGIAHRWAVGPLAALVVPRVVVAVGLELPVERGHQLLHAPLGIEVEHQRADLRPEEVIGAGGPQRGQRREVPAADELKDFRAVVEVADLRLLLHDFAAEHGHDGLRDGLPGLPRKRLGPRSAEGHDRLARGQVIRGELDDLQRARIAGLGGVGPGEETVTGEDHALRVRVLPGEGSDLEAEVEAGALPRQPADLAAEQLGGELPAAGRGGDPDHRVRVHVIDVLVRHKGVERRVDAGRAWVEVEGAVRQVTHHLVLVLQAPVELLQLLELAHVERGEAVELHAPQVAARTFDPEHLDLEAAERIALHHLGRRVPAAEVGDAQIGAQEVRAIQKPFGLAQGSSLPCIPEVGEAAWHGSPSGWSYCGLNALSISAACASSIITTGPMLRHAISALALYSATSSRSNALIELLPVAMTQSFSTIATGVPWAKVAAAFSGSMKVAPKGSLATCRRTM